MLPQVSNLKDAGALSKNTVNNHVSVHITGYTPSGLVGNVNGARALIRNREISWTQVSSLSQYIGRTYEAIVLDLNANSQQLELSLRLAEWDPWQEAADKYPAGQEVEGRVVGLIEGAAFVELEPGVEGFLGGGELAPRLEGRIESRLWIDDHIRALVKDIDPARRRLRLSLKDLLIQREAQFQAEIWKTFKPTSSAGASLATILPARVRRQLLELGLPVERSAPLESLDVLVIEDDDVFGGGLVRLLQRNSCVVTWHKNPPEALDEIHQRETHFDLILIDWGLPVMAGHELVALLRQEKCPSHLVVVLEPAPLNERQDVLDSLNQSQVDVLSKSDGDKCTEDLITILRELRERTETRPARVPIFPSPMTFLPHRVTAVTVGALKFPVLEHDDGFEILLQDILRTTHATTVALVRFDFERRRLSTEACVGRNLYLEDAPPDLIHSPLGDVLEKGREVWKHVGPDSLRYKRLLDLLAFQEFMGFPVPAVEASSYGLILLREKGHFDPPARQRARNLTHVLSEKLQARHLLRVLLPWQAQNLSAQIVSSAIHEINNKLTGIHNEVETLLAGLNQLIYQPQRAQDTVFLEELRQAAENIAHAQRETEQLRDQYLGLIASDEPQLVELPVIAREIIHLLQAEAKHRRILVQLSCPDALPRIKARPSELRQVFLNLLLNAIQQMSHLDQDGRIIVELARQAEDARTIKVRITDEGPGIHRQLWERVFEFGFTKRKGGSGLGLTISRQIVFGLGGELSVEKSYMFWGTTFLLELPQGE